MNEKIEGRLVYRLAKPEFGVKNILQPYLIGLEQPQINKGLSDYIELMK